MPDSMYIGTGETNEDETTDDEDPEKRPSIVLPTLLDKERKFFEIVYKNDVSKVEQFLKDNPKFNINCTDFQGISALYIAIKVNSPSMVKCLLDKPNIDISDCMLHAIERNQIEITQLLLERSMKMSKNREFEGCFNSSDFPDHMTPILLAASCGHYEIIQMLINRGHKVEKPHSPFCKCKTCKEQLKNEDILNTARLRLTLYKAAINPAYISNSSNDPILTAFRLSNELMQRSVIEPNFRSEYINIADQTRQFAVDLIECCRNAEEMELILKQRDGMKSSLIFSHPRLLLAMDLKQKEFVAHSNTQQIVQSVWCDNWYQWLTMTNLEKCTHFLLRFLLLPVIVITYTLIPKYKLSKKWKSPVSKFISHVTSYFLFLILLLIESMQDKTNQKKEPPNTGIEFLIYIFVISHIWNLIRMCMLQGVKRFFRVMWNWYDCVMNFLFAGTLTMWIIQHIDNVISDSKDTERKYWSDFEPILISEAMLTVATIMAFLKLLLICGLNYYLGPLQIALGKMSIDIAKYMTIFAIIIFSFSAGLAHFYQYYDGMVYTDATGEKTSQYASFVSLIKTLKTLFWALFCMSPIEAADVVIGNIAEMDSMKTHLLTETVGYILFGIFEILTVFVIINMLIATMANTFQRVIDNVDVEWTFGRTQVQISYMLQTTLPPPFNLLPTLDGVNDIKNWFQRTFHKKRRHFERKNQLKKDYLKLMSSLMQRYFAKKESNDRDNTAEISSIRNDIVELQKIVITKK